MAKSIAQRVIEQGILAVARETTKPLIKEISNLVKGVVEDKKKKTGKRRDNED